VTDDERLIYAHAMRAAVARARVMDPADALREPLVAAAETLGALLQREMVGGVSCALAGFEAVRSGRSG